MKNMTSLFTERLRSSMIFVVVGVLAVVVAGCPLDDVILKEPSELATVFNRWHEIPGAIWCSELDSHGTAPALMPSDPTRYIVAGYSNSYDGGTAPFPCPHYFGLWAMGAVRFDLDDIESVSKATLQVFPGEKLDDEKAANEVMILVATASWNQRVEVVDPSSRDPVDHAPFVVSEIRDLQGETWVPRPVRITDPTRRDVFSIGVTDIVRAWVDGDIQNHGFAISPIETTILQNWNGEFMSEYSFVLRIEP